MGESHAKKLLDMGGGFLSSGEYFLHRPKRTTREYSEQSRARDEGAGQGQEANDLGWYTVLIFGLRTEKRRMMPSESLRKGHSWRQFKIWPGGTPLDWKANWLRTRHRALSWNARQGHTAVSSAGSHLTQLKILQVFLT